MLSEKSGNGSELWERLRTEYTEYFVSLVIQSLTEVYINRRTMINGRAKQVYKCVILSRYA